MAAIKAQDPPAIIAMKRASQGMESKGSGSRQRIGIGGRVLFAVFKALEFSLSPIIHIWQNINGRNKYNELRQDVLEEMQWTMSNLRPQLTVASESKLAMGRYATVTLRCPNYVVRITREYYYGGHDFWADVATLSEPHKGVRIDAFAKQLSSSGDPTAGNSYPAIPSTLSDLDSLICRFDSQLSEYFSSPR